MAGDGGPPDRLGSLFGRLLAATGLSNLGDGLLAAALPLLVAGITRDPVQVAGATFAYQLPWLVTSLVSGALIDRLDRRWVMVAAQVARAALVASLAAAVALGLVNLPAVYVIAFAVGVAETFFDPATEALVPSLVDARLLTRANGRRQAVEYVGNGLAGPPLGAFLFGVAVALPFYTHAALLVASALLVVTIGGRFRVGGQRGKLRTEIVDGLRWLLRHRVLRTLAVMAGIINLFVTAIVATFVLFAQDVLGVREVGYGLLLTGLGLGGVIGAFTGPRLVAAVGPGRTIQLVLLGQAALTAIAGATSSRWVVGAGLFLFGMLGTAWNIVSVTLRQTLTPDELRGRVSGAARLLAWGSQPVGAIVGGGLASLFGLRAPFFAAGAVWVVMTVLTRRIITNRNLTPRVP
jgi:MFS family permease